MNRMFTATTSTENGFEKIILADDRNLARLELIPSCGAMLHAFHISNGKTSINIIDSYDSKSDFDLHAESKGFRGMKLSPFACRIRNAKYEFDNREFEFKGLFNDGSAIHGLLYREPFEVTSLVANEESASCTMEHKYQAKDSGYPFPFSCAVNYLLEENNALTIQTIIRNIGNNAIPIADGWHPYFTFAKKINELRLQFSSGEMLEFENLIPTGNLISFDDFSELRTIGETEFDNCFIVDQNSSGAACILQDPATGLQLEIYPDEQYPFLQIYTPPHRDSIAIENLSGAPDCFNNKMGLIILESGEEATFSTKYIIRLKSN